MGEEAHEDDNGAREQKLLEIEKERLRVRLRSEDKH